MDEKDVDNLDNIVEKDTPDELLRSVMAQCSKWVEGEKHVTITINIHNNILGDIENLYINLVEWKFCCTFAEEIESNS